MARNIGLIGCALVALWVSVGCSNEEARVEAALERFEQAVESKDPPAAIIAVEDIAAALPDSAESAYRVAHLWVRADEHGRALWLLEDAGERFPEAYDLPITLAEVALVLGNPSRALRAVDRVPADAPQAAAAALLRARAQRDLGDGVASLATLAAAEEQFDDWTDFRGLRIEFLVSDQRFDEALALIREARGRENLSPEKQAWFAESEASLLAREGRVEQALALLGELADADAENQRAWMRRAQLLAEHKRFSESCEQLRAAIEQHPDRAFLYDLLATAEAGRGNRAEVEAAYRARVEAVGDVEGVERLALYLFSTGRPVEAIAVLDEQRGAFSVASAMGLAYLEVAILLDTEDFEAARGRFDEYRRHYPSDPRTEYLRARLELFDGEVAAAAERLRMLLPRFDRSDVQHWYGRALQELGDFEGAENHYGLAIMRNSTQVSSYRALIALQERRGAWKDVRDTTEHLLRVQPENQAAAASLSRALMQQGKPEAAEEFLRLYLQRYPHFEQPTIALVSVLRSQGRAAEALDLLEGSREKFGDKVSWRSERALSLMALGRNDEALAELDRPDAEGPPAALLRVRSVVLFDAGRGEEGVATAERALELDASEPAPLRWIGDYHAERGESAAAIAAYRRYLAVEPMDAKVLFHLGAALDGRGERDAAIEVYRRAVNIDPTLIAPRNNLALALDAAGRNREALAVAQEAYARDADNPLVLDTLGWLYVRAERAERGALLLERAHRLLPDDPLVAYHLAIGLTRTERREEALAMLRRLEEQLAPEDEAHAPVVEAIAEIEADDAA